MAKRILLVLTAALLAAASQADAASAQSLFAGRGLGLVVDPMDARSWALGGVSLGLEEQILSWSNPASAAAAAAPGMVAAFQFDDFSADVGGVTTQGSTARFPLVLGVFPVGQRGALQVGFGGLLDQNAAIERQDSLVIGPDTVAFTDQVLSEGGAVNVRFGAAYRVSPRLALGVAADVHTGGVERTLGRRFEGNPVAARFATEWRFSGVGYRAGAQWTSEAFTAALAVSAGGTLEVESDDSLATESSLDLPVTVNAGASGRITGNTLVALAGSWSGWSSAADGGSADFGSAEDTYSVHGGIEWDGLIIVERPFPVRLGARYGTLPFPWQPDSGEQATERAITGGLGAVLAGGAARSDVAVERGWRGGDAAGITEDFWRVSLSIQVFGR